MPQCENKYISKHLTTGCFLLSQFPELLVQKDRRDIKKTQSHTEPNVADAENTHQEKGAHYEKRKKFSI